MNAVQQSVTVTAAEVAEATTTAAAWLHATAAVYSQSHRRYN